MLSHVKKERKAQIEKNNKRSLSEFETVSVSARRGLFFCKIFVPYLTTAYVYLVGAKSLGAYGGYETFVYKLTEYHQNKENIKYHVACKANGDGCMPALQSLKQSTRRFWKIWKVNAI